MSGSEWHGPGPFDDSLTVGTGAAGTGPLEAPMGPVWLAGGLALGRPPDRGVVAPEGVTEVLRAAFRVRHKRLRQAGPQVLLSTRAQDGRGSAQATQTLAVTDDTSCTASSRPGVGPRSARGADTGSQEDENAREVGE
jgi:hypothetical protein